MTLVPWERLWLPLDTESEERSSSSGYLENWEDIFGFPSKDGPKQLPELLSLRCLVLCGEPGMGKSKVLELCQPQIEEKARQAGELYWRSFREAISPAHLFEDLKSSTQWQRWIGGSELTVVIDGVDEGLALASSLISVLVADLRDQPVTRMRLVLVCRDAEWPVEEGRALMKLWPVEEVGRFRLQRLRYSDAEKAARHWGLSEADTAAFMSAVQGAAVEAFAARPMTLGMLVEEFRAYRRLPGTRTEIFRRACLRLCRQDPSRSRFLKSATRFEFTAEQIMTVVEHVAAVMLLCRYSAISRDTPVTQHLNFESLIPANADDEYRAKVEAALGCALFSDAGNQSRAFAHQSYAEYLAAEYLSRFPLAQVLDLICLRSGETRPVVPQLSELAAWLALRHNDFANWVIKQEPEILLRNDASALTEAQREQFVAGFLKRLEREEAFDDWDLKRFYGSFQNPKLAEQLKPYLKAPKASRFARRAAIHLADLGKLSDLLDDLLAIAKDISTDTHLREQAMNAVCRLIPPQRLSELEPFAKGEAGPDPHDELRGAALKALVPVRWKVSAALPQLAKPSNQHFIGEFHMVCESYLPKQLEVGDLVAVLKELTRAEYPFDGHHNHTRSLTYRALVLACCSLGHADIATELLTFVRTKLRQQQLPLGIDDSEWKESVENGPSNRRQLADLLVGASGMTADEINRFQVHRFIPLKMDDCLWFIQRVESTTGATRALWVKLVRLFWPTVTDTVHRDDFMDACQRLLELGAEIQWPCVLQLGSEEAKQWRETWQWQKRNEEEAKNRPRKPTAQELFDAALASARAAWKHWRKLGWELQRDESDADPYSANLDPTNKYRWKACGDVEREQIVGCAREFLVNAAAADLMQRSDDEFPVDVTWALWLVKDRLAADADLRDAVKSKWFEALFAQPHYGVHEEQVLTQVGVELNAAGAPDCLRKRLMRTLSGKLGLANVLSGFKLSWKAEFTPVLVDFIQREKLAGLNLSSAIRFLARHDEAGARSWLDDQFKSTVPNDLATSVALGLALFPEDFWQTAKPKIETDSSLAVPSLQTVADVLASSNDFLEKLKAVQLADLLLLLEAAFPSVQPLKIDPDEVSPRERIEKLRNFIPERLQALATSDACDQLLRLAAAVPHLKTLLRWRLRDARIAVFRKAWSGVPAGFLAAMAEKHERRWVRSEDDLQELVLDSIARFQDDLNRTEYPTVPDLWNEKPSLSPKDEIALTEKLVRWLANDLGAKNGVALGCQVEPSRVHETDIEVWAQPGGTAPIGQRFLITIEVKCSFNQEVGTSLEKQLVAEYLLKLGRTHGIYLVGWYKGEGWKPNNNALKAQSWPEASAELAKLRDASRSGHTDLQVDAVCLNCEFPQAFRKRS